MRALQTLDAANHRRLLDDSIQVLRIVVGLVFVIFGALGYFPGVSPAEDLILVAAGFVVASTLPGLVPGAEPARARRRQPRTDWTDHPGPSR